MATVSSSMKASIPAIGGWVASAPVASKAAKNVKAKALMGPALLLRG